MYFVYSIFPVDFSLEGMEQLSTVIVFSLHLFFFFFFKGKKAGTGIQKARSKYSDTMFNFLLESRKKLHEDCSLGLLIQW